MFNNVFGSWFKLFHSAHPEKATSTTGVAFVLNKNYLDVGNTPLMLVIPWHKGKFLVILNVYAPNHPK
ncbi:hypothetical protein DFH07DRAFT_740995 [Mycena maculata]|uniref:Uncharacterized protein n=1 Tax=Mycena maculata TaxID=230809 RepID=A0AAD7JCZ6_9AGAR|nr:hypothetical protein DFH07DRAFT_740995 [Mycena maculata]